MYLSYEEDLPQWFHSDKIENKKQDNMVVSIFISLIKNEYFEFSLTNLVGSDEEIQHLFDKNEVLNIVHIFEERGFNLDIYKVYNGTCPCCRQHSNDKYKYVLKEGNCSGGRFHEYCNL